MCKQKKWSNFLIAHCFAPIGANQCANRKNVVIFSLHIDSPHLRYFQPLNRGESMCKHKLQCYAAFCTLICPKCSWGETMCIQKISSNFLIAHWFAPLASKIIFKWGKSMCNKHLQIRTAEIWLISVVLMYVVRDNIMFIHIFYENRKNWNLEFQ